MNDDLEARPIDFRHLTAELVAAYVSNNHVQAAELPDLLLSVHAAMRAVASGEIASAAQATLEKPSAAEIRRSVGRDALVSFEDGRPYKTLKRHLSGRGLTPDSYRAKWGLPRDYPMVAPDYAERRSALAKAIGLGRPGRSADAHPVGRDDDAPAVQAGASRAKLRAGSSAERIQGAPQRRGRAQRG